MSAIKDIPKEFEIFVCGHTRKCKWSGVESELKPVRDEADRANGILSWTSTCPKCGNNEFYIRDSRTSLSKEKAAQ